MRWTKSVFVKEVLISGYTHLVRKCKDHGEGRGSEVLCYGLNSLGSEQRPKIERHETRSDGYSLQHAVSDLCV